MKATMGTSFCATDAPPYLAQNFSTKEPASADAQTNPTKRSPYETLRNRWHNSRISGGQIRLSSDPKRRVSKQAAGQHHQKARALRFLPKR